jgi:hypothetical protein
MENKLVKLEKTELVKLVEKSGIEPQTATAVTDNYQKFFIELGNVQDSAGKINFDNPTQIDEKIARDLRLTTVKIRTAAETLKDERKKTYLLRGNLEQSTYNLIKDACKLTEDTFLQVEKAREIAEKKRKEELRIQRTEKIAEYVENVNIYPLGEMSENDFDNLLIGFQVAKEKKIQEEKQAEQKRLAEIEAEKQRQLEIKKENERLKKEAAEKEAALKIEREKIEREKEIERKKQAEILAKQKEESDRIAKIEAEKQAKIQAELKAKAEKERIEREKIEKELKEKEEAEKKLKEETELKEKERRAAEKKAKNAPDKEKLLVFANYLLTMERPEMNTQETSAIMTNVNQLLYKVSEYIKEKTAQL